MLAGLTHAKQPDTMVNTVDGAIKTRNRPLKRLLISKARRNA